MEKIIDYIVVKSFTMIDICGSVNALIINGWQPIGGICVFETDTIDTFYQAMVKYDKKYEN